MAHLPFYISANRSIEVTRPQNMYHDRLHLETLLAKAGCIPDPSSGAIVAPPCLSTTFERAPDGSYPHGYIYSRYDNPTRHQLEDTLALLEGGQACAAFASGMAAATALLQAVEPESHVLIPDDVYYGVRNLLENIFACRGIRYSTADFADLEAVRAALRPNTRLLWAETPSNPLLKITALAGLARLAREVGARLVVDSTWAPPPIQRPLELGADLVLHSLTKYLSGHSDVMGGALIAREADDFFARIRIIQQTAGAVLDPFSAWLTLRGLRTLAVRLQRQCENARHLAVFLRDHPRVVRVHYPGLPDHPGHEIARHQMQDFGAMLSFEVDGGVEQALAVAARTRVFMRATSLGGTESLIEHRASIETPPTRTPSNLLRLSIGLEHVDDLLADLSQALED